MIAVGLPIVATAVFAQMQVAAPATLTPDQWHNDLAVYASELPKLHKNLFHTASEKDWRNAIARLDSRIPQLERHEIIVELARISAMVRDSHTGIGTFRQPAIDFRRIPIEIKYFNDGLFIVKAAPRYSALLGAKLVKIGRADASAALDSVAHLISQDPGNEMRVREVGPILLGMPEVMNALKLSQSTSEMPITVEQNGKFFTTTVNAVSGADYGRVAWTDWQKSTSLALSGITRKFWYRYLPESRMMFVQINEMDNDSTEYLAETFKKAVAMSDSVPVDRFVIDLRFNSGGSGNAIKPMVLSLIKSPKLDQHGRLFVLTGRVTASAAQNFVNELERFTNSVIIGEPTAQNPSFYSDGNVITLPNSGIQAYVAVIWSQPADSRDNRPYTAPDVMAEWTSAEFRDGRDPAIDAVKAYSATAKLPLRIVAIARRLGPKVAGDSLSAAGANGLDRYRNLSRDVIRFSFDELWPDGKSDDAILLLESNAFAHPGDWNSHDALAGAYENKGRFQDALDEYTRALALNPDHRGVKEGISRVRQRMNK